MQNKCLGVFLVFSTIPLVILSIFLLGSTKLTSVRYYKDLFKRSDSYNLVLKVLPSASTATSESAESNDMLVLISANATPAWLEKTVSTNLDKLDAFINNRSTTLDPSIDITSFKDALSANMPAEIQEMVPSTISFSTYIEYLNNANNLVNSALQSTPGATQVDVAGINKQLQDTKNVQQKFNQNATSVKTGFRYGKIITYIIYALTLLMLLSIALAARRYVPAIFRWTGQTLFLSGLLSLVTAFVAQYFVKSYDLIASFKLSHETRQIILPLYHNLASDILSSMIQLSFLIAGIGLIAIIVSYILVPFAKPLPNLDRL